MRTYSELWLVVDETPQAAAEVAGVAVVHPFVRRATGLDVG